MSAETVRMDAPAKVNLWLRVLHQRADGYHEIDSLMQTISLKDRLALRAVRDGQVALRLEGSRTAGVPCDESNLAVKAVLLLKKRFGIPGGVEIVLRKEIPAGSGLGGGSSDAAAVLLGCCRLWGLRPSAEILHELAAELGSDVPFLLRGGTARCTGRGEKVLPLTSRGIAHFVLIFGEPLSTRQVYAGWDSRGLTTDSLSGNMIKCDEIDLRPLASALLSNALEPVAFELLPGLREVRDDLLSKGAARALMSGSGSCVFGIVRTAAEAARLAAAMRRAGRDALAVRSTGPRDWSMVLGRQRDRTGGLGVSAGQDGSDS